MDSNLYAEFFDFLAPLTIFQAREDLLTLDINEWEKKLVPFSFDYEAFDAWIRNHWIIDRASYLDWPDSPKPKYNFVIRAESAHGVPLQQTEIEGLTTKAREVVCLNGSVLFALEFLRKFEDDFGFEEYVLISAGYDSTFVRYHAADDELTFLNELRDRMDPDRRARTARP